mmetsp:Transcript_42824/g.108302  ORF Transcript_42824/g.108302 Transcript_42824/m.108302 type:complete len:320 (+) Transcript_42824:193-1152(+)
MQRAWPALCGFTTPGRETASRRCCPGTSCDEFHICAQRRGGRPGRPRAGPPCWRLPSPQRRSAGDAHPAQLRQPLRDLPLDLPLVRRRPPRGPHLLQKRAPLLDLVQDLVDQLLPRALLPRLGRLRGLQRLASPRPSLQLQLRRLQLHGRLPPHLKPPRQHVLLLFAVGRGRACLVLLPLRRPARLDVRLRALPRERPRRQRRRGMPAGVANPGRDHLGLVRPVEVVGGLLPRHAGVERLHPARVSACSRLADVRRGSLGEVLISYDTVEKRLRLLAQPTTRLLALLRRSSAAPAHACTMPITETDDDAVLTCLRARLV